MALKFWVWVDPWVDPWLKLLDLPKWTYLKWTYPKWTYLKWTYPKRSSTEAPILEKVSFSPLFILGHVTFFY